MTDTMEVFSNISNEDMTGQVRLPDICRQYRNNDNRQGYKAWWQKARALPRDVKEDGANISLNSQRNKIMIIIDGYSVLEKSHKNNLK